MQRSDFRIHDEHVVDLASHNDENVQIAYTEIRGILLGYGWIGEFPNNEQKHAKGTRIDG